MDQSILKSGRDSLLVAVPLIALLLVGFFRLDEWFFRPAKSPRRRPPARGVDPEGRPLFSDPDGWSVPRR